MPLIDRFALLFGRRLLRADFVSDHEINGVVAFINADSQSTPIHKQSRGTQFLEML